MTVRHPDTAPDFAAAHAYLAAKAALATGEPETAAAAAWVKPRGVAHAFCNPTDKPARTVEVIAPGRV